jgi:hypothetical protein
MLIFLKELGNQQSRYWAGRLGGEFMTHAPDLTITSQLEAGDPVPNPLLDITVNIITKVIANRDGLILQAFLHETEPALIIGSQERSPALAQALMSSLQCLIGKDGVTNVVFEKSFYRY